MTAAPAVDPAVEARVRDRLRGAAVLADLGLRDEVDREVDRVRSDVAGETAAEYALAEALNERGYTLSAINLGWELYRRDRKWNRRLLRIIYPFPYRGMVIPESRERDVDPYLVAGLIRRESAFDPAVTSGAGAIGLMQIMPPTGRTLARSEGPPGFEPALLKQPEVNVHLGTRYLRTMLERFDNRLPLVLSAYNAGPTRAERWKGLPEARDPELFIERIPYSETREYVRKVLLHRALYQALYPVLETD
jgi:soluble lytic murein transglycosylase